MTTTTDRVALTATVERLGAELTQALEDVALLQRLKSAEDDAKRLAIELRTAQEELVGANVAALQAERAGSYLNFRDITISSAGLATGLHTNFVINVTRLVFNGRDSVPTVVTHTGFLALPSDAFGYLIDMHPELVPSFIKALAPDDLYEAFHRYFLGIKRGFIATAAAA